MNRRSFIRTCCGGVAGLVLGGSLPETVGHQGGIAGETKACLLETGEPVCGVRYSWPAQMVAGEALSAGEMVVVGSDGKAYRMIINVPAVDTKRFEAQLKKGAPQIRKILQGKYTHA